ncbi:thymidylate synthase [uncultured Tolumonas sp.]|uniref:thymidylate synthase n=1 Tax=uncultured Tolumonas sp. TaxID=263765 RepID=UPI002A0A3F24|nr:thymidylate synthase [uncultured Tolumonas sp.]
MYSIKETSIGKAWVALVNLVQTEGTQLADEGMEITNVTVQFDHDSNQPDQILEEFADKDMIQNMQFVFFGRGEDRLGHSYKDLMMGPLGENDFSDVVALLKNKEECKRATVTFCHKGEGKVPCINVVNFLSRNEELQVSYFARGQDAYKKFFADAVAVAEMQALVAKEVGLQVGTITGFIASAHNYFDDAEKYNVLIDVSEQ